MQQVTNAGLTALEAHADEDTPADVVDSLRQRVGQQVNAVWERLGPDEATLETPSEHYRRLRLVMLQAEREELIKIRDSGVLDHEVLQTVSGVLDLEESLIDRFDEAEDEQIEEPLKTRGRRCGMRAPGRGGHERRGRIIPGRAPNAWPRGWTGCICGCAWAAGTWPAATPQSASTQTSTTPIRAIRSCARSSRVRPGAGAMSTSSSAEPPARDLDRSRAGFATAEVANPPLVQVERAGPPPISASDGDERWPRMPPHRRCGKNRGTSRVTTSSAPRPNRRNAQSWNATSSNGLSSNGSNPNGPNRRSDPRRTRPPPAEPDRPEPPERPPPERPRPPGPAAPALGPGVIGSERRHRGRLDQRPLSRRQPSQQRVARSQPSHLRADRGPLGQRAHIRHLVGGHQGDHGAAGAGPRGPSGPVQVGLVLHRRVGVHDQIDVIDMDAASRDIGGDQRPHRAVGERIQVPGTSALAEVAVQLHCRHAGRDQLLGQLLRPVLGPGEHQRPPRRRGQFDQHRHPMGGLDLQGVVGHRRPPGTRPNRRCG